MNLKTDVSMDRRMKMHEAVSRTDPSQAEPRRANRLLACLFAALFSIAPLLARAGKYNVVLIISDDLRTELGSYGISGIQTPHIDRLASSGVRFSRAYVQY